MELILKSICHQTLVIETDGVYICTDCGQECKVIKTYSDNVCEGCQ